MSVYVYDAEGRLVATCCYLDDAAAVLLHAGPGARVSFTPRGLRTVFGPESRGYHAAFAGGVPVLTRRLVLGMHAIGRALEQPRMKGLQAFYDQRAAQRAARGTGAKA